MTSRNPVGVRITELLEYLNEKLTRHVVILMWGRTWSGEEFIAWTRTIGAIPYNVKSFQSVPVLDTFILIVEVEPGHGFDIKEQDS